MARNIMEQLSTGRRRSVLIVACIAFSSLGIAIASPTPLTGQYMGTHSHDGEQMLLFKLAKEISSQLQDQMGGQNAKPAVGSQSTMQGSMAEYSAADQQQKQIDESEEQPVSLYIPLSTLKASALEQQQTQSELGQKDSMQAALSAAKYSDAGTSALEQAAIEDYMALEDSGYQFPEHLPMEHTMAQATELPYREQGMEQIHYPAHEVAHHNDQQQRQMANLTTAIEQHVRQFLQRQQAEQYTAPTTTSTTATTTTTTTTSQPSTSTSTTSDPYAAQEQPHLWRDTHMAQYSAQKPTTTHEHLVHNDSHSASAEASSLLARLASSSPELLLRLRSLLHRATQQKQNQQGSQNYTTQTHEPLRSLFAENSTSGIMNQDSANDSMHSQHGHEYGGQSSNSSQSMLKTFLTSHNLTSHEEIKIPLVVIAMPRILSLKRNLLASSQPNSTSSGSATYTYPSAQQAGLRPSTATGSNVTQAHSTASGGHLIQLAINPPNVTQTEHSTAPYIYLASSESSYPSQADNQQQHTSTASSVPKHTMAPYARHFSLPLAPSLMRPYAYQPANETSSPYQLPGLAKFFHPLSQQRNQSLTEQYGSAIASGFVYPPSQEVRPVIETLLVRRPSMSASESASNSRYQQQQQQQPESANLQIQFISTVSQEPSLQPQSSGQTHVLHLVKSPTTYGYQIQGAQERPQQQVPVSSVERSRASPYDNQQLSYMDSRLRPTIYLAAAPQQLQRTLGRVPANGPNENWTELKASTGLNPQANGQRPVSYSRVEQAAPVSKATPADESGLGKLKPLFQVSGQRSNGSPGGPTNEMPQFPGAGKLRTSQMLESSRQSWLSRRPEQLVVHRALQHSAGSEPKKGSKMVFMIV